MTIYHPRAQRIRPTHALPTLWAARSKVTGEWVLGPYASSDMVRRGLHVAVQKEGIGCEEWAGRKRHATLAAVRAYVDRNYTIVPLRLTPIV